MARESYILLLEQFMPLEVETGGVRSNSVNNRDTEYGYLSTALYLSGLFYIEGTGANNQSSSEEMEWNTEEQSVQEQHLHRE